MARNLLKLKKLEPREKLKKASNLWRMLKTYARKKCPRSWNTETLCRRHLTSNRNFESAKSAQPILAYMTMTDVLQIILEENYILVSSKFEKNLTSS